jgi:hypothetical protein
MPDDFIHSTDDDAFQIDQTQLKRNAFIAGAAAWYLANAGDPEAVVMATEVYHSGMKRIHQDALTARNHLLNNKAGTVEASYKEARNLIEQAYAREARALESVRVFAATHGSGNNEIDRLKKGLASTQSDALTLFDHFYKATTGKAAPKLSLSETERALSKKIPQNIDNVAEYFAKRGNVGLLPGLHSDMRYEVFNFVNGKNSYLDIFKAVQAEAISAGEFYYGRVSLETVVELLEKAVQAGCITLK